ESLVLGSESIIAASESAHPMAAGGLLVRMATASAAAVGSSVHRNSSAGGRWSRAAACRSDWRAVRVLPSQKPPDSTPPADRPVVAARPVARIIAVNGFSHPRTGDQRSPAGMPSARCWGSKTATGPMRCRARRVAVRLSGRVLVVTTAPGASRIAGITMCRPLPERGGPMSRIESSTHAHTARPWEVPIRTATSPGAGAVGGGPSVPARGSRPRCEVVRAGAGGDDGAGCTEARRDHDVQALAGAGWADEQDRVLHARPHLTALGGADPVADIPWVGVVQGGTQRPGPAQQRFRRGGLC